MNVVSAVANLVKERDYYQEVFEECRAVIKQLTEGPGEIEYIHPFDLMEMINRTDVSEILEVRGDGRDRIYELVMGKKKYKQSPYIPPKTKIKY